MANFAWDKKSRRYRNTTTGVFISSLQFRNELDNVVDKFSARAKAVTVNLQTADIDIPIWQAEIARQIKDIHISFAAAANGGFDQMSASDWKRVSGKIDEQLQYLEKFAEDIYTGKQIQNNGMLSRAMLYMENARVTYEQERLRGEIEAGMTEESNLLAAGDNCNGCVDATLAGWQPIGTLAPIGSRECQSKCRCNMIYRNVNTNTESD